MGRGAVKTAVAVAAVALMVAGYRALLRDTIAGRSRPHVVSWGMWGLATAIACALQVSDGAGPGTAVTAAAATACLTVAVLGACRGGTAAITGGDVVCLVTASVALILWLGFDQPVASLLLLVAVDVLSFVPTVRKSWRRPGQETLSVYVVGAVRLCLALAALDRYTLLTALYPAVWAFLNGGFAVFLVARRRTIGDATLDDVPVVARSFLDPPQPPRPLVPQFPAALAPFAVWCAVLVATCWDGLPGGAGSLAGAIAVLTVGAVVATVLTTWLVHLAIYLFCDYEHDLRHLERGLPWPLT